MDIHKKLHHLHSYPQSIIKHMAGWKIDKMDNSSVIFAIKTLSHLHSWFSSHVWLPEGKPKCTIHINIYIRFSAGCAQYLSQGIDVDDLNQCWSLPCTVHAIRLVIRIMDLNGNSEKKKSRPFSVHVPIARSKNDKRWIWWLFGGRLHWNHLLIVIWCIFFGDQRSILHLSSACDLGFSSELQVLTLEFPDRAHVPEEGASVPSVPCDTWDHLGSPGTSRGWGLHSHWFLP